MATRTNTMFKQLTSIEHLQDNEETFMRLIENIKEGHGKEVFLEMNTWPKSDREPLSYSDILMFANYGETIVYDDFKHLITANEDVITLYQRIEYNN